MVDNAAAQTSSRAFTSRYVIRRELGRGMMGVVYEAEDRVLGRTVAIKTIELAFAVPARDREEFEHRFFTEARVAAKLSHPGIVVCHDVGKDPESGKLFIVFEHLKGATLAQRVASGPVPWLEAVSIAARIARAIHHAHEYGVIHRDLKPANIMLLEARDPSSPREEVAIKIMDFGVAKVVEAARPQLTAAGRSFGSPLYMSPEQVLAGSSDARSDVFSLGSILCTMLLGRAWFDAPSVPEILARVVQDDPPVLSALQAGLPAALDPIVARALARTPEERYPSAAAMADDLDDVAAGRWPRHVVGWTAPAPTEVDHLLAELTAPAGIDPSGIRTGTLDIASLVDEPPPVPPISRRPWRLMVLAPLAAVAVLAGVAVVQKVPPPDPVEMAVVPTPPPPSPTTAVPTAEPDAGTPSALEPTMATAPEPRSEPAAAPAPRNDSARVTASRSESPRAATVVETRPRTRLRLDVTHPLENGRVTVWLDGALAYEEKLRKSVSKTVVKVVDVEPGVHEVRIEIRWGDTRRSGARYVDVAPGATGLLEARIVGMGKTLVLEWSGLAPAETSSAD